MSQVQHYAVLLATHGKKVIRLSKTQSFLFSFQNNTRTLTGSFDWRSNVRDMFVHFYTRRMQNSSQSNQKSGCNSLFDN